jgi:hypothetical protein
MGWSPFRPVGLTYKDHRSAGGFTLITPVGGEAVYLLDENGQIVHLWKVEKFMPGYGYLQPGGNLLVRGQELVETPVGLAQPAGKADILLELDWGGRVVWRWEHPNFHHDMHRLPNGNTLALIWVPLPEEIGARIKGGIDREMHRFYSSDPHFPSFLLAGVGVGGRPRLKGPLGDAIVEIDPQGKIIKEWMAHHYLDPEKDTLDPQDFREEWTHANALTCTPDGGVMVSFREISTIMILDWPSGEVRWRWGRPYLSCQHSPTITPEGTLLVFDNGAHYPIQSKSRVVEVDIPTQKIIWQYFGSPIFSFFSGHIGGAERLWNGNTLICEGESGRLFEITREGEYVWEWNSPFVHEFKGVKNVQIFRAHRYQASSPELAGRTLAAADYQDLNEKWGLIKR